MTTRSERSLFDLNPSTTQVLSRAGTLLAVAGSGVLVVVTLVVGIPVDPGGSLVGTAVSTPIQLSLAAVFGLAGFASVRFKAASAAVIAIGATGIGVYASFQYSPAITVALSIGFLVPAVLIWLSWQVGRTHGAIATVTAVTAVLAIGTAAASLRVHDHFYGPTHPDSKSTTAFSRAEWLWLGGVTDRSATIVASGFEPGSGAVLLVGDPSDPDRRVPADVGAYGLARFELGNLEPATRYPYTVIEVGSTAPVVPDASFTTHESGVHDLVVAFGSCARTGSNAGVYDAIWAAQPDLFIVLGDLHYGNLESTDPADHVAQYRRAIANPGPARVFSSIPTAYVWDDHDYGPNDADASSPARTAASLAYRSAVPSHAVTADPADPINQAFTVGDVRFVIIDTRSHRTDTSMLGDAQRSWLVEEIRRSSARHELVVWVNPTPWVSDDGPDSDNWSAHAVERAFISDQLAGIENLVMVSGDAHMVAIDDGTHSGYGADAAWGFPVLQAAALDRPGSVKGGPYSHGVFPGGGQFGTLEIRHTPDGLRVRLSGRTWDGRELVSYVYRPAD